MVANTWLPQAAFDSAHTDGNLVTGTSWPAHPAWMRTIPGSLGIAYRTLNLTLTHNEFEEGPNCRRIGHRR